MLLACFLPTCGAFAEEGLIRANLIAAPAVSADLRAMVVLEKSAGKGYPSQEDYARALLDKGILHDERTRVWYGQYGDTIDFSGPASDLAAMQDLLDRYHGKRLEERIVLLTPAAQRTLLENGPLPKFGDQSYDCKALLAPKAKLPAGYSAAVYTDSTETLLLRGSAAEIQSVLDALGQMAGQDPVVHTAERPPGTAFLLPSEQEVIVAAADQVFASPSPRHVLQQGSPADREAIDAAKSALAARLRGTRAVRNGDFLGALADFMARTMGRENILYPEQDAKNLSFLNRESLDDLLTHTNPGELAGWKKFFQEYPGSDGFFDASRVGINGDHTVAILYLSRRNGFAMAESGIYVMRHDGTRWRWIKSFQDPVWGEPAN